MANKIPIKMLVLDLDGTLLDDNKLISERSKRALTLLKDQGVYIVFASGRTNFMMELYQEPYVTCDYHISFNGGMTEELSRRKILDMTTLDQTTSKLVWDYLAQNANAYTAYSRDMMYFSEKNQKTIRSKIDKYIKLAATEQVIINPTMTELIYKENIKGGDSCILKFVAYEDDPEWISKFRRFLNQFDQIRPESTGYGLTGVFDKTVSKENSIRKLCDRLGIRSKEVCSIGDYDNDLNMYNVSGVKVAMENATENLKKQADYICPTNNEDGVACFIEEFIL